MLKCVSMWDFFFFVVVVFILLVDLIFQNVFWLVV